MKIPFVNPAVTAAASIFAAQLLTPGPLQAAPVPSQSQYNTAIEIPQELFDAHFSIYGKVVRVNDGDTMRIRHIPLYPLQTDSEFKGKLSDFTIPVRFYGIDCPEIGKNGNPSMPYADDAKEWTFNQANNKVVKITLLQRDQYNRVVGEVETIGQKGSPSVDLSIGLVHNGYATMYKGKGAIYDGNKEIIEKELKWAQNNKIGMWTNGVESVKTPAEYKREMKAKAAGSTST